MKTVIIIILVLSVLFTCVACDGYAVMELYPYYKADYWYCEEIDFAIYYERGTYGNLKPLPGYPLKINEETLAVFVGFMGSRWHFDLDNGDNIITQEELLMAGNYEYRKGNLVFTIKVDNLFDWKYTEFVFVPGEK